MTVKETAIRDIHAEMENKSVTFSLFRNNDKVRAVK
jgi:hypothetical protein